MGKRPAPVNVGHQQARGVGVQRHAHVDDVAARQIDFGGRTRALNHHHIVLGHQLVQRFGNVRPDMQTAPAPRHGGELVTHLPHQHHLAVGVALGLEQQRIHTHLGLCTGGQRLKILGAANFTLAVTGRHDAGVVAHVLRLEGRDLEALAGVMAA